MVACKAYPTTLGYTAQDSVPLICLANQPDRILYPTAFPLGGCLTPWGLDRNQYERNSDWRASSPVLYPTQPKDNCICSRIYDWQSQSNVMYKTCSFVYMLALGVFIIHRHTYMHTYSYEDIHTPQARACTRPLARMHTHTHTRTTHAYKFTNATLYAYFCCRWPESVKSLFWTMFGYGDLDWLAIVVDNRCRNHTEICYDVTQHSLTEFVGHFLYGMYHVGIILVLLNMLIAMMSNSLTQTQVRPFSVNL